MQTQGITMKDIPLSNQEGGFLATFLEILDRELRSKYLFISVLNKGRDEEGLYKTTLGKLLSLFLRVDIHTLFIPSSIEKFSREIHSDPPIRELVTEVIDKLYILLGKEEVQMFCENLCINLKDFHDGSDELYAGPKQYIMNMFFNPDTMFVEGIMKNHWLLFIVLLTLTFDRSEHFNNFEKI